jgi:hypothetical protein
MQIEESGVPMQLIVWTGSAILVLVWMVLLAWGHIRGNPVAIVTAGTMAATGGITVGTVLLVLCGMRNEEFLLAAGLLVLGGLLAGWGSLATLFTVPGPTLAQWPGYVLLVAGVGWTTSILREADPENPCA